MNKSTKLTDTLDSTKIVKKYLTAIKDGEYKDASLLSKLFPYLLVKPKWEKEMNPEEFHQLVIVRCPFKKECTYCRERQEKEWVDQRIAREKRDEEARKQREQDNVSI